MNTISNLKDKLGDPEYRKAFVASQINFGIPFQIRGLLKSRPGWTQETLADKTGMLQPRISGLMTAGKTRPNIETLRRIAEAFDCGLMVRFVPFSELARWTETFDPESFYVPAFDDDAGFVEHKPAARATSQSQYQKSLFQGWERSLTGISNGSAALAEATTVSQQGEGMLAIHDPKQQPIPERPSATNVVEITELRKRGTKKRRTYRKVLGKSA